jgi:catechol 2,3-dioxygenase-like lactoylglutathione lyase family enzyme
MPTIDGFGHLDFTVTDGERSVRWWQDVMGFALVTTFDRPDFQGWVMSHPSGLIVSVMIHVSGDAEPFDERRVGLDHFALRVTDRAALDAWAEHFDRIGVEHSGVKDDGGGPLIVVRDPDNIQLELWVFPTGASLEAAGSGTRSPRSHTR